jgi:hypothetical protein
VVIATSFAPDLIGNSCSSAFPEDLESPTILFLADGIPLPEWDSFVFEENDCRVDTCVSEEGTFKCDTYEVGDPLP